VDGAVEGLAVDGMKGCGAATVMPLAQSAL